MGVQMDNKDIIEVAKNKKRIFDQTASMHFKLSDEYKFMSNLEDTIEIIISVILCGITFLDCEKYFGISQNDSTLIIGFVSIFLLAFTLVKQGVGHKQLYEKHQLAGKMYVMSKLDLSSKIEEWSSKNVEKVQILSYIEEHYKTLNDLPQIPEKHFARLKHAHQSKVAFSKFLDLHATDFWLVCKLKFRFSKDKTTKN